MINVARTSPFVNNGDWSGVTNNAMLQAWADDYWSESHRDSYAAWPRLSTELVSNNNRNSTWWLRDGSYLRLKTAEIGYTVPAKFTKKVRLDMLRIYLSGTNLFTWSKFKTWDVEMADNGLNYPIQRVMNIGLNVNF